jgi:hypothetical protein
MGMLRKHPDLDLYFPPRRLYPAARLDTFGQQLLFPHTSAVMKVFRLGSRQPLWVDLVDHQVCQKAQGPEQRNVPKQ